MKPSQRSNTTSDRERSAREPGHGPASSAQMKYLRYLLARAHAQGVPYLPVEALNRGATSAWIDYLKSVTGAGSDQEEALAVEGEEDFLPSLSYSYVVRACGCGLGGCNGDTA